MSIIGLNRTVIATRKVTSLKVIQIIEKPYFLGGIMLFGPLLPL